MIKKLGAMVFLCSLVAAETKAAVLEEVLVTAQKRSESVNDVPITITAISGDKISDYGIVDTRDLGKITPGFTFSKSGVGTPVYTLRGVGFNDQSFFASPTVSVYLDEAPIPFSFMSKGPNLDIERVEVLKGPQGTLFGRNTTGGAINYIGNKPSEEFEARISGAYGSYETVDIEGMVSGPVSDRAAGRIALRSIVSGEGWQESISRKNDTLGKIEKHAARARFDMEPSNDLNVSFILSGWVDKSDAQSPQAIAVIPQNPFTGGAIMSPRVENAELVDPNTDDNSEADWTTELDLKLNDSFYHVAVRLDWLPAETYELVSITSYAVAESDGSTLPSGLDALVSDYKIYAELKTLSQEIRFAASDGEGFDWMVGVNFARDEGDQHNHAYDRDVSSAFPIGGVVAVFTEVGVKGEMEARQASAFSNFEWSVSEQLQLTLGARYNEEETDFEGCSFDEEGTEGTGLAPLFTVVAASRGSVTIPARGECFSLDESGSNEIFSGTLKEDSVSGKAGINWTPSDVVLAYLSYSKGTKSGGFPVLPASDQSQYAPVTQEKLTAWEMGLKLTLLEGSTQFNVAAFDYDYTDKQLLTRVDDPFFGPLPILRNAPKSMVRGAEFSLSSAPVEGLLLGLAASWIKTEIEEFESLDINGQPRDFSGRPFNYSPELQYTVSAAYEWLVTASLIAGVGGDYSYRDESNATLEGNPLYQLDEYGVLDLRVHVGAEDGRWEVSLFGRNVTDEFQAINVYQIADIVGRYTGMPSTYGVRFVYEIQ